MYCRLLPISEFSTVALRWDDINREHYSHPLLESRFVSHTLRYFGNGQEQIALLGAEKDPDAIAVLAKNRLASWGVLQASQSPLGALIVKPGIAPPSLVKALFDQLPRSCQVLSVTQQDPDILPRPESTPTLGTLDYIDTARITVDGSFEEYWASRGKNLRHNMKRQRNRLEREGIDLRLEILTQPGDMYEGVRDYGDLESAGWKTGKGTAVHVENAQGRFYADLLKDYASTGDAGIYRFFYGDRLAAVDLCIWNESVFVILKTTYDESVNKSSPALLMRREYFPPIFESRMVERIEFYGKVMDWHTKWSDEIRTLYHINGYRNALVARLHNRR